MAVVIVALSCALFGMSLRLWQLRVERDTARRQRDTARVENTELTKALAGDTKVLEKAAEIIRRDGPGAAIGIDPTVTTMELMEEVGRRTDVVLAVWAIERRTDTAKGLSMVQPFTFMRWKRDDHIDPAMKLLRDMVKHVKRNGGNGGLQEGE